MNRRDFFGKASVVGLGLLALPKGLKAHGLLDPNPLRVAVSIGGHGGHSFAITLSDIVLLYSRTQSQSATFDIQGSTAHGHEVSLDFDDIKTLLTDRKLEKESSSGFGHTHKVELALIH